MADNNGASVNTDALQPGPEADCLLAVEVMGWQSTATPGLYRDAKGEFRYSGESRKDGLSGFADYKKFRPTTDANAAFELAERVFALGQGWPVVVPRDVAEGNVIRTYAAALAGDGVDESLEGEGLTPALALSRLALVVVSRLRERAEAEAASAIAPATPATRRFEYGLKERVKAK